MWPDVDGRECATASLDIWRRRIWTNRRWFRFLSKPKNAIVRQYQKLFEFENVRLKFSDDALEAIAALAMERKVGARGLRMILEDLMLDLMYYIPSYKKVREFQVTKEMVLAQKISLMLLEKAG